ncbi:hypothetical protein D9X30_4600 (plasmid) [Cupriavidus sp. U2]|nr:hypothetical protein D9X30_4600 [Cupriavidus sp. U2]
MTLSVGQRRLIALMSQGHKLLILRSPIGGRIVGANLWEPDRNTVVESIPLWRVEKLIAQGRLRPNALATDHPKRPVAPQLRSWPRYDTPTSYRHHYSKPGQTFQSGLSLRGFDLQLVCTNLMWIKDNLPFLP